MYNNPHFCDGLWRAMKMWACRSALDSIKHEVEGGNARRGFAICLQRRRGEIKRDEGPIFNTVHQSPTALICHSRRCWLGLLLKCSHWRGC